jgi:hypothetical protein
MVNGRWVVWNCQSQTLDAQEIVEALHAQLTLQQNPEFSKTRLTTSSWELSNYLKGFYAQ